MLAHKQDGGGRIKKGKKSGKKKLKTREERQEIKVFTYQQMIIFSSADTLLLVYGHIRPSDINPQRHANYIL